MPAEGPVFLTTAFFDPDHKFQDLANTVRKCWTDLGVHIYIPNLDRISKSDNERFCAAHGSFGVIEYPDRTRDESERYGLILYLKCSLTRDEYDRFVDIRQYADSHEAFPHQTTGDQFFDEEQFEAYRALGYKVANSLFYRPRDAALAEDAVADFTVRLNYKQRKIASVGEFFERLRNRETEVVLQPEIFARLQELRRAHAVRVPEVISCGAAGESAFLLLEHLKLRRKSALAAARLGKRLASQHRQTGQIIIGVLFQNDAVIWQPLYKAKGS